MSAARGLGGGARGLGLAAGSTGARLANTRGPLRTRRFSVRSAAGLAGEVSAHGGGSSSSSSSPYDRLAGMVGLRPPGSPPPAGSEPSVEPEPASRRPRSELLDDWADPGTAVYANPICSQMDQLLLKCEGTDDVLALLVTHRGVFFVHNLVTAIQVLGALMTEAADHLALNALLRDPRYDLLVRDLLRFVPKLDFLAMANVACSLRQLDHKQYVLFSRMLVPLLKQPPPDTRTLLRCIQAYSWAGYHFQDDFFKHFAVVLAERAPGLSGSELVETCALFGSAARYQVEVFQAVERSLVERGLLREVLAPHEVSVVAKAFAAHLRTCHDDVMAVVAEVVARDASRMEVAQLARCLDAFRRLALRFDPAVHAALAAAAVPLRQAWLLRQPAEGVKLADVATLLECAAFFGVPLGDVAQPALDYLHDHVEQVGEQAAIHTVFAMCLFGEVSNRSQLLLYLFRKIGAGTAWERHKVRIFQIWVAQLLEFPWLDAKLPKRCVESGMRANMLSRRGFGCPFPDEAIAIAAELQAMGVPARLFVPVPESPYEIDVAVGSRKDAFLIASEVSRNSLDAVGGTLLQLRHLKARGWRCVVIPRRLWLSFDTDQAASRRKYLENLLTAFAD